MGVSISKKTKISKKEEYLAAVCGKSATAAAALILLFFVLECLCFCCCFIFTRFCNSFVCLINRKIREVTG